MARNITGPVTYIKAPHFEEIMWIFVRIFAQYSAPGYKKYPSSRHRRHAEVLKKVPSFAKSVTLVHTPLYLTVEVIHPERDHLPTKAPRKIVYAKMATLSKVGYISRARCTEGIWFKHRLTLILNVF